MKDLSKETISLVVSALISVRLDTIKELQDAQRAGHLAYQSQVQQALDENSMAIRELNDDFAPWLSYHPQLLDVFEGTEASAEKAHGKSVISHENSLSKE